MRSLTLPGASLFLVLSNGVEYVPGDLVLIEEHLASGSDATNLAVTLDSSNKVLHNLARGPAFHHQVLQADAHGQVGQTVDSEALA